MNITVKGDRWSFTQRTSKGWVEVAEWHGTVPPGDVMGDAAQRAALAVAAAKVAATKAHLHAIFFRALRDQKYRSMVLTGVVPPDGLETIDG